MPSFFEDVEIGGLAWWAIRNPQKVAAAYRFASSALSRISSFGPAGTTTSTASNFARSAASSTSGQAASAASNMTIDVVPEVIAGTEAAAGTAATAGAATAGAATAATVVTAEAATGAGVAAAGIFGGGVAIATAPAWAPVALTVIGVTAAAGVVYVGKKGLDYYQAGEAEDEAKRQNFSNAGEAKKAADAGLHDSGELHWLDEKYKHGFSFVDRNKNSPTYQQTTQVGADANGAIAHIESHGLDMRKYAQQYGYGDMHDFAENATGYRTGAELSAARAAAEGAAMKHAELAAQQARKPSPYVEAAQDERKAAPPEVAPVQTTFAVYKVPVPPAPTSDPGADAAKPQDAAVRRRNDLKAELSQHIPMGVPLNFSNTDPKLAKQLTQVGEDLRKDGWVPYNRLQPNATGYVVLDGSGVKHDEDKIFGAKHEAKPGQDGAQSAYFTLVNANDAQKKAFSETLQTSEQKHGLRDASGDLTKQDQRAAAEVDPNFAERKGHNIVAKPFVAIGHGFEKVGGLFHHHHDAKAAAAQAPAPAAAAVAPTEGQGTPARQADNGRSQNVTMDQNQSPPATVRPWSEQVPVMVGGGGRYYATMRVAPRVYSIGAPPRMVNYSQPPVMWVGGANGNPRDIGRQIGARQQYQHDAQDQLNKGIKEGRKEQYAADGGTHWHRHQAASAVHTAFFGY